MLEVRQIHSPASSNQSILDVETLLDCLKEQDISSLELPTLNSFAGLF